MLRGVPVRRYRYFTRNREVLDREFGGMGELSGRARLVAPAAALIGAGMLAVARLQRRESFDVIHSHWPLPNGFIAASAAGRGAARPALIGTFHGAELTLAMRKPSLVPLLRRVTQGLDAAIANSTYTAGLIRNITGVEPAVIPLGAPRGAASGVDDLEPGDLEEGLPFILSVGRMVERKGFRVLVRAAPQLRGRARILIAGDGEGRAAVEAEIERQGVGDVVKLLGRLPNDRLAALYRRCAVFCLPAFVDSRGGTETLGVVLIEAMTHGKPTVASQVGGIVDVVRHGETGLLVSPEDPEALAGALLRLLENPALAARLGLAGRKRAGTAFSWEEIARRHAELYGSVSHGDAGAPLARAM